ncbi:hypothetical protein S40288_07085 [Stachybotrys chartarum IBT 40288]|nr:hypothetical protein S40288_07085 [Stachybotrys chartarum IBT 40288]
MAGRAEERAPGNPQGQQEARNWKHTKHWCREQNRASNHP